MNLLLLRADEVRGEEALLEGARAEEIRAAHDLTIGISIRAGVGGGRIGHATVSVLEPGQIRLRLALSEAPPKKLPVLLAVGISRPQTIKKVIQAAVTTGVTELHFMRCELAEKSYLKATVLSPSHLSEEIELGLSQAIDTVAPRIEVHEKFRPFFEDFLPSRLRELGWNAQRVVADTVTKESDVGESSNSSGPWVLAVGPEAGWSQFEGSRLRELEFSPVSLGTRILRVETAVTALIARTGLLGKVL